MGFVKIFDHEGNELTTVEELVDKYYNNSEEYFTFRNVNRQDDDENDDSKDSGNLICSKLEDSKSSSSSSFLSKESNCNDDYENIEGISRTGEVSEYIANGENRYELDEYYPNDIKISKNNTIVSNKLFDEPKTNNFLFSDQISYKCNYCDNEFWTEKEHLKHCLDSHEKRPARPNVEMIQVMKENGEYVESRGNLWE